MRSIHEGPSMGSFIGAAVVMWILSALAGLGMIWLLIWGIIKILQATGIIAA